MSPENSTDLAGIPLQYQLWITWAGIAAKYLCELWSSVRAGGGLRRILLSFWFGENLPRVVAEDYRKELENDTNQPPKP
jgi:hypothetical protein